MDLKNYVSALQYGATIGSGDLGAGAANTAAIAAGAVTGAKLAVSNGYYVAAANIAAGNGTTSFFGTVTSPVAGTITGVWAVSGSTGTTSVVVQVGGSTVATVVCGTTAGLMGIGGVLNGANVGFTSGASVFAGGNVAGALGTAVCWISFTTL